MFPVSSVVERGCYCPVSVPGLQANRGTEKLLSGEGGSRGRANPVAGPAPALVENLPSKTLVRGSLGIVRCLPAAQLANCFASQFE